MMFDTLSQRHATDKQIQNDQFFISHKHYFEDGLPNTEELNEKEQDVTENASVSSVVRTSPFMLAKSTTQRALFSLDASTPMRSLEIPLTLEGPFQMYR
jgi:hypothetical protein